ncbi:MAG: ABC transporter ATP-binding protein [Candidatus Bathyarchaeia archaeon]|nr:MAG: ABC transporter ATP-binding protein [Candidatus Bathyarchaeota archaeon]
MNLLAELKSVTKVYGKVVALDNVNMQVNDGEILALLGPNGSGKTTLLKILAFLEKPSKGEVYFCGKTVTEGNVTQIRMNCTMVFQKTVMFNATVYDNVAYGLKIRKMPRKEIAERVNKALELVGLEGFNKRHAKKLSGGEQQRVALARAIALNTKLLLLDEPTANLDPKNAALIEEIIAAVNRELKTTIVMATHNMFQARSLPNRIALMNYGRISEIGEQQEIFGKLSKTLASFAALENTFVGEARTTENGTTLINIGNNVEIAATNKREGKVSVFISPEDIILSKNPFKSSARNILKGRIIEISDIGSVIKLRVDVGKPFAVQITKRSFSEMKLDLNSEVYITFKASSVQIL